MSPDDQLAALAPGYVIIDGYWISPRMLDANSYTKPGRVVCTNGVTIRATA